MAMYDIAAPGICRAIFDFGEPAPVGGGDTSRQG